LGLDAITALASDLRDYARDRSRDLKGVSERDESLRAEAHDLRLAVTAAAAHLSAIDAEIAPVLAERDSLVNFLAVPVGDSHAEMQGLLESERKESMECDRVRAAIVDATAFDIPLAMIGSGLMTKLRRSLSSDAAIHGSGAIGSENDLQLLLERLGGLIPGGGGDLSEQVRRAWAGGLDAAGTDVIHHPYLDRAQHREVEAAAQAISEGRARVGGMLEQMAERKASVAALANDIAARRQQDERRAAARETLGTLSVRLDAMFEKRDLAAAKLAEREADLAPVEDKLAGALLSSREAAPRARRADRARALAVFADQLVEQIAPRHFDRFAAAVTKHYRILSHKSDVAGIQILTDGNVVIRDGSGRDISDLRRSAGESQIFAMALIAAVGEIAGPALPLIVDTPFGRLDTMHRASALESFASRAGQTILLVQPEEFGAREHEQIAGRIAGAFEIAYRSGLEGSIGTSVLRPEVLAA